ncbi:MAG: response regulator, partial [Cyanobacteriota bacterium]|nr:response regulator [Cyanobacteriota bacterium]
ANAAYDLLLLDVVLPEIDGITLCRQLRELGSDIPILLLTARNKSTDKVEGLNAGADDYLIKPFDLEELLARIRALLRRSAAPTAETIEWGNVCLHLHSCEARYRDRLLPLTPTEYSILELLFRRPQQTITQPQLIEHVWKFKDPPGGTTLRSHIKSLRKKFKASGLRGELIKTIYGVGYRLERVEESDTRPDAPTEQTRLPRREQKTLAALRQYWEKFRNGIFQDIDNIERVVTDGGQLSIAIDTAHKLVGILGGLRLLDAARLASEIENLLRSETRIEADPIFDLDVWVAQVRERLSTLRQMLENPQFQTQAPKNPPATPPETSKRSPRIPLVAIVDDDIELAEELRKSIVAKGLQASVANSLSEGKAQIERNPPDAVVLDLCFPQDVEDGFYLLAQLRKRSPQIPAIILTVRGTLDARAEAANFRTVAFLCKPCTPEQVLHAIERALQPPSSRAAKIAIVDDDPNFLSLFRSNLQSDELEISTLDDPQRFWEYLETVNPDLLVLDLSMPDFSGFQLARVIRNDPRWQELPIICLTAYYDRENLERAFAVGADDCLNKSLSSGELRTRLRGHLQRVRRLRNSQKGVMVGSSLE